MKQNTYTFLFATIICVISAVLLSGISEGLKEKQKLNEELDVKKNILKAVQLQEPVDSKMKAAEVLNVYETKIEELVIDENGEIVEGKKISDIQAQAFYPLYVYKEGDQIMAYAFPIVGQGLWSTLYGYMALEADVTTVRGVTFYKHGETPGLGGEIEKEWFQNNFKGKTIWSTQENKLTPIAVLKGKVSEMYKDDPEGGKHYVDGITAATLTGNGVTDLIDQSVRHYEPYFSKQRKI